MVLAQSFDVGQREGKLEAGQQTARLVRQEQTEAARAPPGRPPRKKSVEQFHLFHSHKKVEKEHSRCAFFAELFLVAFVGCVLSNFFF